MLTVTEIEEELLLRDGVLPLDTVQPTSTGDWPTVAGRKNFVRALERRAVTRQGEMVFRPLYGGALVGKIGTRDSESIQAATANDVRINVFRDPRVTDARVEVHSDDIVSGRVYVELVATPLGFDQPEATGFAIEV